MGGLRRRLRHGWWRLRHPPRWLRRIGGLLGPTTWTALALLLVVVVFVILDVFGVLEAWAPNVAVGAASIAITISIVDRIVSREVGRAFRQRRQRLLSDLFQAINAFAYALLDDYRETHADLPREQWWGGERVQDDSRRMLRFWEHGLETETNSPRRDELGRRRVISLGLKHLEPSLASARVLAQEVEDHESVIEIDESLNAVRSIQRLMELEHKVKAPVEDEVSNLQYLAMTLHRLVTYVEKNWGWPPIFD